MERCGKGTVCVTGGTGYLASWLIMKLLHRGYTVHATVRFSAESKRDVSYLTDLPGASERLRIFFNANLEEPGSFDAAIEGCTGVFHVSHPMVFKEEETEEESIRKAINGTLGILGSCANAKTVKRVVYTSSVATVLYPKTQDNIVDENTWSDVDYIRSSNVSYGSSYFICKTLTENACLEFAEKHGLDVVSVLPSWISGPFITPNLPGTVRGSLVLISGGEDSSTFNALNLPFVHTDDAAEAHIFLFEHPEAKGRYLCSAIEITFYDLAEFLSTRYPEHQVPSLEYLKKTQRPKWPTVSSKKLLDLGFKFRYGLEEIYDDAIRCCKEKSLLL